MSGAASRSQRMVEVVARPPSAAACGHAAPVPVPAPVNAAGFSGEVVLTGCLTPTGSQVYDPPCLDIAAPVVARIDGNRIVDLDGPPDQVARIRAHYRAVADRFGIDPDYVHSWHAGLHPACRLHGDPDHDRDLWSNTVFGNPAFLHFHCEIGQVLNFP